MNFAAHQGGGEVKGSQAKETDAAEAGKKYLVFQEGEYTLALNLECLRRVYDTENLPPRTVGTRILDLREFLALEGELRHHYWMELELDQGRYLVPVEKVEGIRELNLAVPLEYPAFLQNEKTGCFKKMFFDGLRMVVELDPDKMAEAEEKGLFRRGGFLREEAPGQDKQKRDAEITRGKEEPGTAVGSRFLVLEVQGRRFSVNLQKVRQVMSREEIYPVPAGGKPIAGVVYYKDHAVPVIPPSVLLNGTKPSEEVLDFALIIIVDTENGPLGVGCDKIVAVKEREESSGGEGEKESPEEAVEIHPEKLISELE